MILIIIIVVLLFSFVGYGIYLSFGKGKDTLRDTIDEHAKLHELGIAHDHRKQQTQYNKIPKRY
tara:strand:- start:650 stop:841 length:192 start_codon:yes stop_codon:yes gene_type:complete